jgi:hypothetical protein
MIDCDFWHGNSFRAAEWRVGKQSLSVIKMDEAAWIKQWWFGSVVASAAAQSLAGGQLSGKLDCTLAGGGDPNSFGASGGMDGQAGQQTDLSLLYRPLRYLSRLATRKLSTVDFTSRHSKSWRKGLSNG